AASKFSSRTVSTVSTAFSRWGANLNESAGLRLALAASALLLAAPLAAQTPEETARAALAAAPVWDGHNDVPIQLRARFGNVIGDFDFADTSEVVDEGQPMHTDFAR